MKQETLRILVVDHDRDHALLMEKALRQELGTATSSCSSAREALKLITQHPPHAVVLDYDLPDTPGPQAVIALRARLDVPVIVVTDQGSEPAAVEALKVGAEDYLPKAGPYLRTLPVVVLRALNNHQRRRQDFAQLKHTAQALASSLELDAVIQAALDGVMVLLQPDAAWLLLPGPEGTLELVGSRGLSPDSIAAPGSGFQSRASAPVVLKREQRPGFLCAGARVQERFGPRHLELLSTIASHTATAVQNAQLFASVSRAKAQWERTFDSIPDPILISDHEFRLIRINRAAARCLNLPLRQASGRICHRVLLHSDQPCPWHSAILRGVSVSSDRYLSHLQRWFCFSAFPFEDQEGHPLGVVHVLRDVTDERKLSDHLSQAEKLPTQPAHPENPLMPHESSDLAHHHLASQETTDE